MVNIWAKENATVFMLTTVVTFWATLGKFGLLFNLASGHCGSPRALVPRQKLPRWELNGQ